MVAAAGTQGNARAGQSLFSHAYPTPYTYWLPPGHSICPPHPWVFSPVFPAAGQPALCPSLPLEGLACSRAFLVSLFVYLSLSPGLPSPLPDPLHRPVLPPSCHSMSPACSGLVFRAWCPAYPCLAPRAWGRARGHEEATILTPPQHTQALFGGDIGMDAASFYDRVWAAVRDKYRSEVCGGRGRDKALPLCCPHCFSKAFAVGTGTPWAAGQPKHLPWRPPNPQLLVHSSRMGVHRSFP
jgi:hypothetical protein